MTNRFLVGLNGAGVLYYFFRSKDGIACGGLLQGWRKILHLIFSLNHDDNMPLSLKCIASTSDAIF